MQWIRGLGVVAGMLPALLMAQNQAAAAPQPLTPAPPSREGSQSQESSPAAASQAGAGNGEAHPEDAPARLTGTGTPAMNKHPTADKTAENSVNSGDARSVVASLNQAVVEAMRRANKLGYEGRYRLLAPVIREVYDFRAISRHVLGDYWKRLDKEQKRQFVDKMTAYGIAEYAGQFDGYQGEKFVIESEAPFRKRYRVVKARLQVPKDDDVEFVYILRKSKSGWKIIDVRYDGVSDLALKRGQFAEILEKGGLEDLLARLDEKIADYASGHNKKDKRNKKKI